jgi:hypothetical protein
MPIYSTVVLVCTNYRAFLLSSLLAQLFRLENLNVLEHNVRKAVLK